MSSLYLIYFSSKVDKRKLLLIDHKVNSVVSNQVRQLILEFVMGRPASSCASYLVQIFAPKPSSSDYFNNAQLSRICDNRPYLDESVKLGKVVP